MSGFLKDLQYGQRTLRKSKGFAAVAVLTMGVAIAANTTVFSWINGVLLHPLGGIGDPAGLLEFETVAPSGEHLTTSYLDYRDIRDSSKLLDGIAVTQPRPLNIGEGARAERIWGELVSGDFFDVMRVKPALGRFFVGKERDDTPGGHLVAVISYTYWKNHFHLDPAAVGSTLRMNRYPFTIIGVAPDNFNGSMASMAFDIWLPAMTFGELAGSEYLLNDRKSRMFLSVARLKPGVGMERARAELQSLAKRLAESYDNTNHGMSLTVVPFWRATYGAQKTMLAPLSILMGICGVVLLIACANVTNLLLARATARSKEFSVRQALGASSRRLIRQLLVETLLLALAGALLGIGLSDRMRDSLAYLVPATTTPRLLHPPLDWSVLSFAVALALVVTLGTGLLPAFHAVTMHFGDALKEGGRGDSGGAGAHRLRGVLVVAEVALAVVALVGAGLFLKSFQMARTINPGFDPHHVAIAELEVSTAGYNEVQTTQFCRRLRQKLESTPGVEAVSFADSVPLGFTGASWEDLQIQGYVPGSSENMKIYRNLVSPGYFDLMRTPLLEGRDFTDHDDSQSPMVMIVNQEFARRFLPRQSAIGRKVQGWGKWFTIVGVVKDGKYLSFTESPQPYFYIPIRQIFRPEMGVKFYVRASVAPEAAVGLIRRAVTAIDPDVAMLGGEALNEHIGAALYGQKVAATLLGGLGVLSLLLAAIGLYSVMAYSVLQRTREIGIRLALGAEPADVMWLALHQGLVLASIGLAVGLTAATALARLASPALAGVSYVDPAVYSLVAAFLGTVAMVATLIPAVRAARVDPMVCLRVE